LPDFNDDEYPPEFLAQSLHYLGVTGWDRWYLAVLILGTEFKIYQIDRADYKDDIEKIQRQVYDFWTTYVIPKVAPPPDGTAATGAAIANIYNSAVEGSIDLSGMEQHFVEISMLNERQTALEKEKERHKQSIKLAMGENTRAECSCYVANWKPRKDGIRVFTIKEKRGA
jgi:predicted phage-related endonuclease